MTCSKKMSCGGGLDCPHQEQRPLRVWWIPQVPGVPFHHPVESLAEARNALDMLAKYDRFQYEHLIKPDYSNAGGLQVLDGGEWEDWYDEDGDEIDHEKYREVGE